MTPPLRNPRSKMMPAPCPPLPLESLVARARAGDERAYAELFHRYQAPLRHAIAAKLTPELGHHLDADDVLQETFLAAFRALDRHEVRGEASFVAWLARIAERKLRDAVRYCRRDKRTPRAGYFVKALDPAPGRPATGEPCHDDDPAERLGWRELSRHALRYLAELEPELREVVVLRVCHEVPWHECARRLGRNTIGAVRHLHGTACGEIARRMKLELGAAVGAGLG